MLKDVQAKARKEVNVRVAIKVFIILINFAILLGLWNGFKEEKVNQKIDELMHRVELLTLIAHIEYDDLPDRWDPQEFKIVSLERSLRDLELYLLNRTYQEKDRVDNRKEQ